MIPKTGVVLRRRPKCFQQPTTAARVERDYARISQIGSDCSQQAGMGRKKSKNRASLLAEFLFLPCLIRAFQRLKGSFP